MKSNIHFLFVLLMSGASGLALAGSESGFYLGGSVGSAELDYSDHFGPIDVNFNDSDTGYKVFGGYNFGLVPFLNLAVEASYVDFGQQEDRVQGINTKAEVDAATLTGLVGVNLGPLGVFAKAGVADWDGDFKAAFGHQSESGTDPVYGVGAKIQLGSFAVRAEYEYFDLDKFEIDYYSIGASYTF